MSRQFTGLLLAGLASFCAVIGVILSGILAGRATLIPLDEHQVLTMTATGASYYSPTKLVQVTGANIEQTETITGVGSAASSSIAVWSVYTTTWDTTRHQQLEPTARRLAVDRASAQLVSCCSANINGNGLIRQYGVAGYVFPPGTRKQGYDVFDAILGKPVTVAYSGQDMVGGIPAYRFTEDVTAAPVGFSPQNLTNPELYSVHRVYWVDPETGALLNVSADVDLYLDKTSVYPVEHVLAANLTATGATVAGLVSQDARARARIATANTIRAVLFPVAVGLAVIAAGLLLVRRRRAGAKAGDPEAEDSGARSYEPVGFRAWQSQASRGGGA